MSQEWAIDFEFGLQQLNNFMFEVSNSEKIDFSARRESSMPAIISAEGQLITRGADFKNSLPGSILHLKMSGTMRSEDGLCSRGINSLITDMYDGFSTKNIDGIFMEVDSGGGESAAGHKLHNAMLDKNKPVLVFGHRSGSAAVMGTLAADEIVGAGPSSEFGSVGTYISLDKKFIEWYKENVEDIYADVSGDKNGAFRAKINGDSEPLRKMVTKHAKMFQSEVAKYRGLTGSDEYKEKTLSGGMFYANEAKNRGLIDYIGTKNDALRRLRSHINYSKKNK